MRRILLLALCTAQSLIGDNTLWMIIGIHGTVGVRGNASFGNIYRILMDEVENSQYDKAVNLIRENPYIFQNQAIQELGLHAVHLHDQKPGNAAALFCSLYDEVLTKTLGKKEHRRYYTFGWSGVLSESIRYKSGQRLYHELFAEYTRLQKEHPGQTIKICVMGYSHGATVALNLASVLERERPDDQLPAIDQLILLGAPVQVETAVHVMNPLFKKVYHVYSREDHVQKMDCFSFKRFFSLRRFSDSSRFIVPDKVVQIELKIKDMKHKHKERKRIHYQDRSPGHIELWFFGWENGSYRQTFPLHPLPTAIIIPSVISAIHNTLPHETDVVVTVYPDTGQAIVRKRGYHKKASTTFLEPEYLAQLRERALAARPEHFTREDYTAQIQSCIKQAYGMIETKPRAKKIRR